MLTPLPPEFPHVQGGGSVFQGRLDGVRMLEPAQIVNQIEGVGGSAMIWGWVRKNTGSERRSGADSYSIVLKHEKEQDKNICIQNTNIMLR